MQRHPVLYVVLLCVGWNLLLFLLYGCEWEYLPKDSSCLPVRSLAYNCPILAHDSVLF